MAIENRHASVGSRRLWSALLEGPQQISTGEVTIDSDGRRLVGREWRIVEFDGESVRYATTVTPDRR